MGGFQDSGPGCDEMYQNQIYCQVQLVQIVQVKL